MTLDDTILYLGGIVGALGTLAAGMWWLVWPRIEDKLQAVARELSGVNAQLTSNDPDTVRQHAKVAARAAAELPLLRADLQALTDRQAELSVHQSAVDKWRGETDRRLGSVEEALIALLGRELRNRVIEDDRATERPQVHHHLLTTTDPERTPNHDD